MKISIDKYKQAWFHFHNSIISLKNGRFEEFKCYLSSFLSASRSIIDYIQQETIVQQHEKLLETLKNDYYGKYSVFDQLRNSDMHRGTSNKQQEFSTVFPNGGYKIPEGELESFVYTSNTTMETYTIDKNGKKILLSQEQHKTTIEYTITDKGEIKKSGTAEKPLNELDLSGNIKDAIKEFNNPKIIIRDEKFIITGLSVDELKKFFELSKKYNLLDEDIKKINKVFQQSQSSLDTFHNKDTIWKALVDSDLIKPVSPGFYMKTKVFNKIIQLQSVEEIKVALSDEYNETFSKAKAYVTNKFNLTGWWELDIGVPLTDDEKIQLFTILDSAKVELNLEAFITLSLDVLAFFYEWLHKFVNLQQDAEQKNNISNLSLYSEIDYIQIALLFEKCNKFDEAIKYYSMQINKQPKKGVYSLRGCVYFKLGDEDKALFDFLEEEKINPTAELYYDLAHLYYKKKDYKNASSYIEKGLSIKPNNVNFYWLAGWIHSGLEQRNWKKAVYSFEKVINSDNPNKNLALSVAGAILADISEQLLSEEEKEKSLKYCKLAIENDKNNAEFHFNLGQVYCIKGRRGNSIELGKKGIIEYQEAIRLDANNGKYYLFLADICRVITGRQEDAHKYLLKALILDKDIRRSFYVNINIPKEVLLVNKYLKKHHEDSSRYNYPIMEFIRDENFRSFFEREDIQKQINQEAIPL